MQIEEFAVASSLTTLQTPAAIAASGSAAGVDINTLRSKAAALLMALNTAGTTPTLAIKLQHAPDGDVVTSVTPGSNTGNGTCTQVYGGPDAVAENITLTFSNATTAAVVGSVSGALGNATVGTLFSSANVEFMLTAGSSAWVNGDTIVIVTTARTYVDVGSGAFTGLTTGASIQKIGLDLDKLKRYMRVNYTIGGTVSPSYTLGIVLQSLA
ncbi:MAG: hypothetical protein K8H84_10975 [Sulfuricella denitrificans]|nr:hypothetical protein [Sulfuricella denitrificans]